MDCKAHPLIAFRACGGVEGKLMKVFAIVWLLVGAGLVAASLFFLLTQGLGATSTTIIATTGCIGIPFLGFGAWGLYTETKPPT